MHRAGRPYMVLLPVGFTMPAPLPVLRCALTAPFHPYRANDRNHRPGGLLSVALSLGSPPPGVTRHRVSVEPGLSSSGTKQSQVHQRPSDHLIRRHCRLCCCDRQGLCRKTPHYVNVALVKISFPDQNTKTSITQEHDCHGPVRCNCRQP